METKPLFKKWEIFIIIALGAAILFMIGFIFVLSSVPSDNRAKDKEIIDSKSAIENPKIDNPVPSVRENTQEPSDNVIQFPTLRPSSTSIPSQTPIPSFTPRPNWTHTPAQRSTVIRFVQNTEDPNVGTGDESIPTNPETSPTRVLRPTQTKPPKTTVTCGVIPSSVSGASNTPITFWAQFSPPASGLGFDVRSFDPTGSGQRFCNSGGSGDDGYASCTGSSGMHPYHITVTVILGTSVGNCVTSFSTN